MATQRLLMRNYQDASLTGVLTKSACRALDQWAFEHGVYQRFILQNTPTQNGFIERFNGRFHD
jgi:transposase InsO family protein